MVRLPLKEPQFADSEIGSFLFGNKELSGIKQIEMRSQNVGRLIGKFMQPFFFDCT
jgi:hypothetical protein